MDSCHIFNFLFGTKKATSELSKCFTSISEQTQAAKRREADAADRGQSSSQGSQQQPPRSPFKQLQMKIVSLASQASAGNPNKKQQSRPSSSLASSSASKQQQSVYKSCDQVDCGTYRATLVESVIEADEEKDDERTCLQQDDDNSSQTLVFESDGRRTITSVNLIENPVANYEDNERHTQLELDKRNNIYDRSQAYTSSKLELEYKSDESDNHLSNATGKTSKFDLKQRQIVLYENESFQEDEEPKSFETNPSIQMSLVEREFVGDKCQRVGELSNLYESKDANNNDVSVGPNESKSRTPKAQSNNSKDKRSAYVRNIVQSFESTSKASIETADSTILITPRRQLRSLNRSATTTGTEYYPAPQGSSPIGSQIKPITYVKPMPPKTPPKTIKAKYFTWQLGLSNKPTKIEELAQDEKFLHKLFNHLEPLDRCTAAQVCRKWRSILYANSNYWKDLVSVIDCTQLRRDQLVECIVATLQTATLKQQSRLVDSKTDQQQQQVKCNNRVGSIGLSRTSNGNGQQDTNYVAAIHNSNSQKASDQDTRCLPVEAQFKRDLTDLTPMYEYLDQDDIWRIQDLCNRYTHRNSGHLATRTSQNQIPNCPTHHENVSSVTNSEQQQQTICLASKSSSIPSQISSTFSSVSLSSLLSPLSESSRVESIKEKLYASLDERGFDAICLFGATDDDIEDLINKMPSGAHTKIQVARLNNCCITDRGLDTFISTFCHIEELELSGCNEITNAIEFKQLHNLKSLIVTDCINIADGFAQRLIEIFNQLEELTIQAYHLTDAFVDYLSLNADTSNLKRLELPDCKEVTNQSLLIIAKHLQHLQALSLSGSTKISDDGIEILAEQATNLKYLDLSWCTKISDASLECIACDLGTTLTDLILDRNIHITDNGVGYLATMSKLTLLHLRWCPRITDVGLEMVISIKSLKYLSVAGLHHITARSLLCLVETDLEEVELTNCQAVNNDLITFLSSKMPKCNIIF